MQYMFGNRRNRYTAALLALVVLFLSPGALAESAAPGGMDYVLSGGYIYYSVETERGGALFRMLADGTGAERIGPHGALWLSVTEDQVFYADLEDAALQRMDLDGSNLTPMLFEPLMWVAAAGDFVYVLVQEEGPIGLVRLPKDAGDPSYGMADPPERMTNEPAEASALIRDGWIYWPSMQEAPDGENVECWLYKMRTDRSGQVALLNTGRNCGMTLLDIVDGRLHYALLDERPQLCSVDLDGGDNRVDADIRAMACADGWVYYQQEYEVIDEPPAELEAELGLDLEPNRWMENALFRLPLGGGEPQQITVGAKYDFLSAAGDWLFFQDDQQPGVPSMMHLDGTGRQVVPGYARYISPEEAAYDARGEALEFGSGSVTVYVTSDDRMAAYKLFRVDADGALTEARSCVLEPNTHAYLYVEPGTYVLKTAEGSAWISDEEAFGATGRYTTTEPTQLYGGYRYSIGTGPKGDFHGDTAAGFAGP